MEKSDKTLEHRRTCPHVGVEHPMNFQCGDCEDTADDCNCNFCGTVFCNLCQKMVFIDCDAIVQAWQDEHPYLNMGAEKIKLILLKRTREINNNE